VLFTEEQVTLFQNNTERFFSKEELTRIGTVQLSHCGKPHFIHRTFAEYFVADFLVNRLTEGNNNSEHELNFIQNDIFMKGYYQKISVFIAGLFTSSNLSDEVLKQCGNRIYDLGNNCVLMLHRPVVESNVNIVSIVSDSLQTAEHTDTLVQLLLAKDNERKTVWLVATERGNIQLLEKLRECAKEKLSTEKIKNKLVLVTDDKGRNVLHVAVECGRQEILEELLEWANENLTTEEINNKLLLATEDEGRTVFHAVAERGRQEILQKLWEWVKEKKQTEETHNKLLLSRKVCRAAD